MKRLKKIDGSCAVVALLYCSGMDEETVIRVCQFHGFEAGKGMTDDEWHAAARDLKIKFRLVAMKPCTLGQFIKNHPKGLYLIGTHDHLFVVDNGIIVDPRNTNPPGLKRSVKQSWRVTKNPV